MDPALRPSAGSPVSAGVSEFDVEVELLGAEGASEWPCRRSMKRESGMRLEGRVVVAGQAAQDDHDDEAMQVQRELSGKGGHGWRRLIVSYAVTSFFDCPEDGPARLCLAQITR